MRLTPSERELLERALDDLAMNAKEAPPRVRRQYMAAVAIVRERPDGMRRVRSDFGSRRRGQMDALEDGR